MAEADSVSTAITPPGFSSAGSPAGHSPLNYQDEQILEGWRTPSRQPSREGEVDYLPFEYEPLDQSKREIRLIELLSIDQTRSLGRFWGRGRQLLCSLRTISLDDAEKLGNQFNALSHNWGDPSDLVTIWINNKLFNVEANLFYALAHIQSETRNILVWVDAICIHQKDDIEKASQIQQIRQIYEKAALVIVWLGVAEDGSDEAFDSMNNLAKAYDDGIAPGIETWKLMMSKINTQNEEDASYPLDAMFALLARPWWHRVWAIHEISCAKSVIFKCADKDISDYRLLIALHLFYEIREATVRKVEMTEYERKLAPWSPDPRVQAVYAALPLMNAAGTRRALQSFRELLQDLYISDSGNDFSVRATDPRDLIFALIGISRDANDLSIVPNYTKSCQELYIGVAKALLPNDMAILACAQFPKRIEGLPSWVPDWSSPIHYGLHHSGQDPGGGSENRDNPVTGPPPTDDDFRTFTASGNTTCSPTFKDIVDDTSKQHSVLSMPGVILDTIQTIGRRWNRSYGYFEEFFVWMQRLLRLRETMNVYGSDEAFKSAAWHTSLSDKERLSNGSYCRVRQSYLQDVQDKYDEYEVSVNDEQKETLVNAAYKIEGVCNFMTSMNTLAHDRRPFMTSEGWIGMGPRHLKKGEVIVVFEGAKAPFILRTCDDGHYHIVGEAYVHGFMDGEIMKMGKSVVNFDIY